MLWYNDCRFGRNFQCHAKLAVVLLIQLTWMKIPAVKVSHLLTYIAAFNADNLLTVSYLADSFAWASLVDVCGGSCTENNLYI